VFYIVVTTSLAPDTGWGTPDAETDLVDQARVSDDMMMLMGDSVSIYYQAIGK
jgi:hypothetical protein